MTKIVDHGTTNRLAEAALLLLDAAREAAKDAPDYRPGKPNVGPTLALAVQSLIIADHLPPGGASLDSHPMPPEFIHRWRGVAAGLGVSIGALNKPDVIAMAVSVCASTMTNAALDRIDVRSLRK